jgi:hypothetical protein
VISSASWRRLPVLAAIRTEQLAYEFNANSYSHSCLSACLAAERALEVLRAAIEESYIPANPQPSTERLGGTRHQEERRMMQVKFLQYGHLKPDDPSYGKPVSCLLCCAPHMAKGYLKVKWTSTTELVDQGFRLCESCFERADVGDAVRKKLGIELRRKFINDEAERHYKAAKEAAKTIDVTAETTWFHCNGGDPYDVYEWTEEEREEFCIGRHDFARAPGTRLWVSFGDLPPEVRDALDKRDRGLRNFPNGWGILYLKDGILSVKQESNA